MTPKRCRGCEELVGATHRPGCPQAKDDGVTRDAVQPRDAIEPEPEPEREPTLFD